MEVKTNSLIIPIIIMTLFSISSKFVSAISVDTPVVPSSVDPGDIFVVKANVTETSGYGNISETNVSCVGTGGTEWIDSWDSYTRLNQSMNWTFIDSYTIEVNTTIRLNTSSINGSWTCRVYGTNSTGFSAVGTTNQLSVVTFAGITVSESFCEFEQGLPGDANRNWTCPLEGNKYLRITHEGNVKINLTINGTDLVGVEDSSWTIGIGNLTYTNVTSGSSEPSPPGVTLSNLPENLIAFWERGTYPSKNENDLYCWLSYPLPLKTQAYQGTIFLDAKEA